MILNPCLSFIYLAIEDHFLMIQSYFFTTFSINGETVYTHRGERSEEDIVEFVKKASG